jgi:hypothetical protein
MDEEERKYLHLRMLINDIKSNCCKINLLTAEAVRLKHKFEQIEIVNNDTESKIKEAIERELCLGRTIFILLLLFIIYCLLFF